MPPAQRQTALGQGDGAPKCSTGRTVPSLGAVVTPGYRTIRAADLRSDLHPLWHRGRVERWRPVPGLSGAYEISDLGRVRSVARFVTRSDGSTQRVPGRLIRPTTHRSGHLQVALYRNGKRSMRYVHRLVLEAFGPPAAPGFEMCRHWNDNPEDNRAENLIWGTDHQNRQDRERNSRRHNPRKRRCACRTCQARARERSANIARANALYPLCGVCGNAVVAGQGTVHFSCDSPGHKSSAVAGKMEREGG